MTSGKPIPWFLCAALFMTGTAYKALATQHFESLDEKEVRTELRYSDLVFVGDVRRVSQCFGERSGIGLAYQTVEYGVSEILDGKWDDVTIRVGYYISSGDSDEQEPDRQRLREELFRPGKRHLVFVRRRPRAAEVAGDEPSEGGLVRKGDPEGSSQVSHDDAPWGLADRQADSVAPVYELPEPGHSIPGGVLARVARVRRMVSSCYIQQAASLANPVEVRVRLVEVSGGLTEVLLTAGGQTKRISSDVLSLLAGPEYSVQSVLPSPVGTWTTVSVRADERWGVIVVATTSDCPLVHIDGVGPTGKEGARPQHVFARSPLWLSETRLAFLTAWEEKVDDFLWVYDLETGERSYRKLDQVPTELSCDSGVVRFKNEAGVWIRTAVPCTKQLARRRSVTGAVGLSGRPRRQDG